MESSDGIRWKLILRYGVLTEILIYLIVLPVFFLMGSSAGQYLTLPLSFLGTFVFGWIAAGKVRSRPVIHGILIGIVAMFAYIAIIIIINIVLVSAGIAPPAPAPNSTGRSAYPLLFLIGHLLKVLGGAAGGFAAVFRRT